jgi:hypothetical protein
MNTETIDAPLGGVAAIVNVIGEFAPGFADPLIVTLSDARFATVTTVDPEPDAPLVSVAVAVTVYAPAVA